MARYSLIPHPDFPSVAVTAIQVDVGREGGALELTFAVEGNLSGVAWPETEEFGRRNELWKHTCFEAFVRPDGGNAYTELNFSPSGPWAAYSFDSRRTGMRDFEPAFGEVSGGLMVRGTRTSHATLRFWTFDVLGSSEWLVGLSAVIEAKDGTKSYWALAHAPGPPDFHNPDCFIATLPAPSAS